MRFTETRDAIVSILQHNLEVQQSGKATDSSILNPYLQGEPGIGKTCCIYSALSILGSDWGSYMLRLADCEPSVLGGQRYPNKDFSIQVKKGSRKNSVGFRKLSQGRHPQEDA